MPLGITALRSLWKFQHFRATVRDHDIGTRINEYVTGTYHWGKETASPKGPGPTALVPQLLDRFPRKPGGVTSILDCPSDSFDRLKTLKDYDNTIVRHNSDSQNHKI